MYNFKYLYFLKMLVESKAQYLNSLHSLLADSTLSFNIEKMTVINYLRNKQPFAAQKKNNSLNSVTSQDFLLAIWRNWSGWAKYRLVERRDFSIYIITVRNIGR